MRYKVFVPLTAKKMKKSGNFNVEKHKTWFQNPADYKTKTKLMNLHFQKVIKADAILVVNKEKKGMPGYIGGNALMEIAIAHHYKKRIYILYPVSDTLSFKEEVLGVNPIFLDGDVKKLPR